MVCIAAFIILALIGVIVAILSIFKKDIGAKYWKVFKKAWHCVFKKVRLQKCDTSFKDDVKNTILRKVILTHPKWVKPLSVIIEILSVVIVIIAIWSLVIAVKSLLALWVFGTCNISQPSQCGLGAESCTIDQEAPKNPAEYIGRIGSEWAQLIEGIPDRLKTWNAEEYLPADYHISTPETSEKNIALDVIDPGCSVCMQSYKNQKSSGFFNNHQTYFLIYPIELPDGTEKFPHSTLIARYIYALNGTDYPVKIINRLYTEYSKDGVNYQSYLTSADTTTEQVEKELNGWLKEWGMSEKDLKSLKEKLNSETVNNLLKAVKDIVDNKIHAKGIPTLIYDGKKHNGLYKLP